MRVRYNAGLVRAQQESGECRAQGKRIDRRENGRDGDGQRKLTIELTLQTAQECGRDKHRSEHRSDRDDRTGHLVHRTPCGLGRWLAVLDVALDVLDDDDRIVDDDTDRKHQAKQRQGVERETHQVHNRKGTDK
ncbi:hypothetical protein D3C77_248970 [compost metagenome]